MGQLRGIAGRTLAIARQEVALLAVLALLAASLWIFVSLSAEVVEGDTHAIDQSILLALRTPDDRSDPLGPGWVEELGRDVTALDGMGILIFITIASAIYLVLCRKYRGAVFVVIAIASGIALSFALKAGLDRPRPDLVPHGSVVYTASFPSGHSMLADHRRSGHIDPVPGEGA